MSGSLDRPQDGLEVREAERLPALGFGMLAGFAASMLALEHEATTLETVSVGLGACSTCIALVALAVRALGRL